MKKNLWKNILQIGVIALIAGFILKVFITGRSADPEAYCPFGGLESLMTYLHSNTLACSMSMVQIMMGVILAVGVILFSKLFCGYVCPIGTVSHWSTKLRKRLKISTEIKNGSIADKALRLLKYALLFLVFYMTVSSSELFCKKFDPYYAVATGFKGEIVLWMSILSLLTVIVGSLFSKMFWCKYICPLGALSNVFRFTILFIVCVILGTVLSLSGVEGWWIWALVIACIAAYLIEILWNHSKIRPTLSITRDAQSCTQCKMCDRACPYQISVSQMSRVDQIDCTLCGECISACKPNALTINHKKGMRWIPAIMVVVLFGLGLLMGNIWELPTIDERWNDADKHANLETLEQEGMRSIKCYGSSMSFSARMQDVPGVYGVRTYVKSHRAIVYYDPAETTPDKIKAMIFTPVRRKLADLPDQLKQMQVVTLGIDRLFDRMDILYLARILQDYPGFYGIESQYACPVKIRLFMDPKHAADEKELARIIETRELKVGEGEDAQIIKCNYDLVSMAEKIDTISRQEFLELMFPATSYLFEDNQAKYPEDVTTAIYEVAMDSLDRPEMQRNIMCLGSFLADQPGVIRYQTALNGEQSVFRITYVPSALSEDELWKVLQSPKWTIHYTNGNTEEMDASFQFTQPGRTLTMPLQSNTH